MYTPISCESSSTPPNTMNTKPRAALAKSVEKYLEAVLQRHNQHIEMQNEPRVYAKALGEHSLAAISPWLDRT